STNGFDRFNDALKSLDEQLTEMRENFDDGRKKFETQINKQRNRVETRIKKTDLYKRTNKLRKDIEGQVESARAQVYDAFGIASKTEIEKLHRKLNTISRKLNEISREQAQAS
ncbi:MAG: hypothetical protein GY725_04415, partial [bacterium]|nr:hypothetical protein [bacterium]